MSYYFYVLAGGVLWGSIGIFVQMLASSGLTPMEAVTARATGATIVFALITYFSNPQLLKIKLKDWWIFFGSGFISLAGFNYFNFTCITLSGMATAALLLYTAPVFVMLMSLFLFKEKLTARKCMALLCTICGCTLIVGVLEQGLNLNWSIVGTGLASGVGYALYTIFTKYAVLRKYHPLTVATYTFLGCAVAAHLVSGGLPYQQIDTRGWLGIAGIVFICSLGANYFYTKGLAGIDASHASIIATVEPLVAALLGILVFGEPLAYTKIMGMLLILGSIVLLSERS